MSEAPQVWITRADPGATATAGRLRAIGLQPLIAPVLRVQPLDTPIDFEGVTALAFTSMNGVDAYLTRRERRDLPVFAIGDATARRARRGGFAQVWSADGEMSALTRMILGAKVEGVVLQPGAVQRAGDLVGALKRGGLQARTVNIYETPTIAALPAAVTTALTERALAGVLLHSPRAAEAVAELAASFDLSEMTAFGLSGACLRPLRTLGFQALVAADKPAEAALLDALLRALGNPARPR